ncbi:hypothetical protein IHV25_09835 [Phaeovibrio sulfidiphilus]|uniref:Transmembrane protein n=1 Tax=Phaeovibrio sulfidiphilus TaxID=1220600 RepID=A0A8J6YK61_9PROT|nr:hypothetical protein [Phaeovibrio sulfidiphilus]MBE1237941.1 hypothetical protein [Phaeovibrio sulfidiphilus]
MTATSQDTMSENERMTLITLYALYFLGVMTIITGVIAFIMILRRQKTGGNSAIADSHYTYMVRTFLVVAPAGLGALVLYILTWGFLAFLFAVVLLAVAVWALLRCLKGVSLAINAKPIPEPESFGLPS